MLGPPCMSWPFVIGVAGVDAGVTEFWVPVSAWAACKAAWAEAFWNEKKITFKKISRKWLRAKLDLSQSCYSDKQKTPK